MDLTSALLQITDWLEKNVCTEIELKVPPEIDAPDDDEYDYKTAHPTAFPLFVPASDKLPPGLRSAVPCICVQLMKGVDTPANRELTLALGFATWNPGPHRMDWINGAKPFQADMSGWMDCWNMVDITARKIQSSVYLGPNIEIMLQEPMEYGPYRQPQEREDEMEDSFYPMWFAYFQFKVRMTVLRNNEMLKQLL